MSGKIIAVSTSPHKGQKKENRPRIELAQDYGVLEDAHGGDPVRQVSLLAMESIRKMREKGLEVSPGDFAENITTEGLDLSALRVGDRLRAGEEAFLQISQRGKTCHNRCAIYYQAGHCVMPGEGVFAVVLKGGTLRPLDRIAIEKP